MKVGFCRRLERNESIMKCDYCGYENKPDVRCCAFCGVELMQEESVKQEYNSSYVRYKEDQEKQERRKQWEKMFQADQKQMPSSQKPPVWRKDAYQENHIPEKQDKDSLGDRLKRMPLWIKIILLILLFSEPAMAVFWFVVWMIFDQSKRK